MYNIVLYILQTVSGQKYGIVVSNFEYGLDFAERFESKVKIVDTAVSLKPQNNIISKKALTPQCHKKQHDFFLI